MEHLISANEIDTLKNKVIIVAKCESSSSRKVWNNLKKKHNFYTIVKIDKVTFDEISIELDSKITECKGGSI